MTRQRGKYKRRKTLFEQEHGPPKPFPEGMGPIDDSEIDGLDPQNLGYSLDPADSLWIGGREKIDVDAVVEEICSPDEALRRILLAIIDSTPDVENASHQNHKIKPSRIARLETAMQALKGEKSPSGRPASVEYDAILVRVAERFWLGYELDERTSLRQIMIEELISEEERTELNDNEIENRIKPLRKRWDDRKHQLLVKASGKNLPEFEDYEHRIARVLDILRKLNVL